MEERIDFSEVPNDYPLCLNRQCNKANTCLRQLAEQAAQADRIYLVILNPKNLATIKGACPHYRPATKTLFAKGFIKILESIPYKQMQTVIDYLIVTFGRRTYYRIRKGERLMSPDEQKLFFNVLKECGVSATLDFDGYIEKHDW